MSDPAKARLDPRDIAAMVALIDQGRTPEAEIRARTWANAFPDAGIVWKILSVALLRQGKDALAELRRAATLMPQDAEALANLGHTLTDRGLWAEALGSLQRLVELQPKDVRALVRAADALRELGRAHEALPLYHRALRLEPRDPEARNNLGNAFLRLGQFADAAGCYRLALEVLPNDPQILCNLGTAQRLLGFLDEALTSTQRALEVAPTFSTAYAHRGLILAASGDRDGANAAYRQALALNPDDVDALDNLAHQSRDLGLRRDAVALYARAIRSNPARADGHCNIGMVLFELRRIDDAVAAFKQALALQPSHAAAHLNLGMAQRQMKLPEEAYASCKAALAIAPDYVEALTFLGELNADRGRFTEAEDLFRKALSINPSFAPAYSSIATHRKMTPEDSAWAHAAQALIATPMPLTHAIGLHYSLGKYHDDIRQFDAAFEHYRLANEMSKRFGRAYDSVKLTAHVGRIESAFDAGYIERQKHAAKRDDAPIFIVGMPRSGTSLVEQILASHPAVFGAGELTFWDSAYHAFSNSERGKVGSGASVIARAADDYMKLLRSLAGGAQRVVDKLPANFLYLGLIHAALPNARIIHMQRHPIDTCLSIYFQNFFNIGPYANDLGTLAHYYREYAGIMNHWRNVLPPHVLLDVPYESLLDDQESWTRRLLDFVGLPWDPKCLAFDETDRVVITASKWQVRQKIHKGSAGRWRHYERFAGPLMPLADLCR